MKKEYFIPETEIIDTKMMGYVCDNQIGISQSTTDSGYGDNGDEAKEFMFFEEDDAFEEDLTLPSFSLWEKL